MIEPRICTDCKHYHKADKKDTESIRIDLIPSAFVCDLDSHGLAPLCSLCFDITRADTCEGYYPKKVI